MKKRRQRRPPVLYGHEGVHILVQALIITARPDFCAKVHPDVASHHVRMRARVICGIIVANRNA